MRTPWTAAGHTAGHGGGHCPSNEPRWIRLPVDTGTAGARATRNDGAMSYRAADDRYDSMTYRRTGRSGLDLPAISLGLWHNFGDDMPFDRQRPSCAAPSTGASPTSTWPTTTDRRTGRRRPTSAGTCADDFAPYRDELVISTKAGYDMWPGPYGQGGGSRKYLLASLDQSLRRMGLDYVDIFYSHRPDPTTPLEETMGALRHRGAVGQGAVRRHLLLLARRHPRAAGDPGRPGTPLLIHQPSYSMLNRWIETEGLLDALEEVGAGCIAFSPLAQGMLTGKYLDGIPEGSRASQDKSLSTDLLTDEALGHIRALTGIAEQRGQSLAQLALAWALRDRRVTSVLIGASSVEQLDQNLGRCENLAFSEDELAAIDQHAVDAGIDLWEGPRTA